MIEGHEIRAIAFDEGPSLFRSLPEGRIEWSLSGTPQISRVQGFDHRKRNGDSTIWNRRSGSIGDAIQVDLRYAGFAGVVR